MKWKVRLARPDFVQSNLSTLSFLFRGAIYGLTGIANFLTLPLIMIFIVPSWKSVNVTSAYEVSHMTLQWICPRKAQR